MSKLIIYGAGLIVVTFIVGLLIFLTFDNAASGQAIYGNRLGSFTVSGPASVFVNVGILGMVSSFLCYISYLFSRNLVLLKGYKYMGAASVALILLGLACGQT